jgi:small subunit ribosomal protein S6e
MPEFQLVVSDPKKGIAYKLVSDGSGLVGKSIGDEVDGSLLRLDGYKLVITGGSDRDGFPLRRDLPGSIKKRILLAGGVGYHPKLKGRKERRMLRGREISPDTSQINLKIVGYGSTPVEKLLERGKETKKKRPSRKAR